MIVALTFDLSKLSEGIVVAVVGYLIVFAALLLLYFVYSMFPKIFKVKRRKSQHDTGKKTKKQRSADEEDELTTDVSAAISAALYLFLNEAHDDENTAMTIKRVSRTYSPWSSKIYGVRFFNR